MEAHRFVELFQQMSLVRRFEEEVIALHAAGHLPGHFHVYIGQEATGVAAVARLEPRDVIFTTHRSHGHLLARGADVTRLFAEILGRRDGYSRGKAGTLHLAAPELGVSVTSALVGGSVPLATGAALALARGSAAERSIVVCFFGDGVFEEGALYEALNIAALWRLPILFICENNSVAPGERRPGEYPSSTYAGHGFVAVAEAMGIPSARVDGRDIDAVDAQVRVDVEHVRAGAGPRFVEAHTERWPGSRGMWPALVDGPTSVDHIVGAAAPPAGVGGWLEDHDPLRLAYREGEARGWLDPTVVRDIDAVVRRLVSEASAAALASPAPDGREAFEHVRDGSKEAEVLR